MRSASRIAALPFRHTDLAWLAAFRVLFGLAMFVSSVRFLAYGWVDEFFVKPSFYFKYWGFAWVEPLPQPGMHALFWALSGLSLAMAAGLFFRLSAAFFSVGFVYLQLIDVTTYLNHYYLAALVSILLAVSPAHRALSLDAILRPRLAAATAPAGWLYLFRFQIGVVYTFAGVAKFHGDWLLHAQPLGIWLGSRAELPLLGRFFALDWAPLAMSWAGFLFDSTIALWLSFQRTRPYAYLAVIFFHVVTGLLFPIGMFPVIMILSALVFFPPDWPRALLVRIRRGSRAAPPTAASFPTPLTPRPQASPPARRAVLALGVTYCVVQLALPLRFLAYGGNVRWHEQGMRFSWRVMVREKNGAITFLVREKRTGRVREVDPSRYLTRLQEREMSGQPDLILQLAHHIRDDYVNRGRGPVEVRVDARASLNGRRSRPFVDPNVDLAAVEDGLARADWILPEPDGPPPRIRPIASGRI